MIGVFTTLGRFALPLITRLLPAAGWTAFGLSLDGFKEDNDSNEPSGWTKFTQWVTGAVIALAAVGVFLLMKRK